MSSKLRMNQEQLKEMDRLLARGVSKSETARRLKVSRPTLDKAIVMHIAAPEKPKLLTPRYVQSFQSSEMAQRFVATHKDKLAYIRVGRESFRVLNNKDPSDWNESDYDKLWAYEGFKDNSTGKTQFNNAVGLRRWMVFTGHTDLTNLEKFSTKNLKKEKGLHKTSYLKTLDEMIFVINSIQYPDTLVMLRQGSECGARISSLLLSTPKHIDETQGIIIMFEPKVKKGVDRDFNRETIAFIRRYANDFNIHGDTKLYQRPEYFYNADMKQAGKIANIDFDLTSHKAMKHTFVTQASAHGVSLEVVSAQTGTDPSTLSDFYLGIGKAKKRHELLGEPYPIETYGEWIHKLDQYYIKRYEEIKKNAVATNGIGRQKQPKPQTPLKPKVKRVINWDAVKAMIANPKTPPTLKLYWEKRLKDRK